jgi:hypothetical protein
MPAISNTVCMKMTFTYPGFRAGTQLLVLLIILMGASKFVYAQETEIPDSLQQRQRARMGPPGQQGATTSPPEQEGQVNFSATDSLTFVFGKERIATLYGSSTVTHTSGRLEAGKISMNLDQHLVSASTQTPEDTLSQPVLIRGDGGGGQPSQGGTSGQGGSLGGQSGGFWRLFKPGANLYVHRASGRRLYRPR